MIGASVRDPAKLQARLDEAEAAIIRENLREYERHHGFIDISAKVTFWFFLVLAAAVIVAQVAR